MEAGDDVGIAHFSGHPLPRRLSAAVRAPFPETPVEFPCGWQKPRVGETKYTNRYKFRHLLLTVTRFGSKP